MSDQDQTQAIRFSHDNLQVFDGQQDLDHQEHDDLSHFDSSRTWMNLLEGELFEGPGYALPSLLPEDDFLSDQAPGLHTDDEDFLEGLQNYRNDSHTVSGDAMVDVTMESPASLLHSEDYGSILPKHYGPGYWLSVCSTSSLAWVQRQVGSDEFAEIAQELQDGWRKHLRLQHEEPPLKSAEPEPQVAWKYCNAYFERSVDNVFDVVYRPDFERLLRAHLSGKIQHYNAAWYALRNVVYAAGCRLERSKNPAANFVDVQREAWGYFSNSLSVHSELLLRSPSVRSIQALLAMATFAEGLGSPALSSGLIANAALLAQTLNLHKEPAKPDGDTDPETLLRTWLFWAVYCCEKHVAQRFGRPSVIDDDDIRCVIPTTLHPGSTIELEMFPYIIQTCQIYNQLGRQLSSTQALQEPAAKMLDLVTQFDMKLRSWRDAFPAHLRPPDNLKHFQMPSTIKMLGLMTIHCSYYDLVMIIHGIFAYPWVTESFPGNIDSNLSQRIKVQVVTSSYMMANAARSLIVIARKLDMARACTQSFMLHFPMHAFMNLFIYVIRYPGLPTVQSDLALLDVAAGHFGQMEFVTDSKVRFGFARDIAALARRVVEEHSGGAVSSETATAAAAAAAAVITSKIQFNEPLAQREVQHLQFDDDFHFDKWLT